MLEREHSVQTAVPASPTETESLVSNHNLVTPNKSVVLLITPERKICFSYVDLKHS